MKKLVVGVVLMMTAMTVSAQEVTAPEPEFVNSYCILTCTDSYDILPKETGTVGQHQNKVSKWSKIAGKASLLGGAAGMIGVGTAGSLGGMVNGVRVMTTASGVGSAASAVNGLAGSSGMDIVFKGGKSAYKVKNYSDGIRLLVKGENNEYDPMDCYRIVRFNTSKKERRIQWMEIEPALLGSKDAEKAGYIQFAGHKYGEQSYILDIPVSELKSGEYGIFYLSIASALAVPVGTFSIE